MVAGYGAWYLTWSLGFFILAPSTDDGYYIIAALGTVLNGVPSFWIGDEFSPTFFLPTAFTFFYGMLLKLTIALSLDFGALGFRFYQFIFLFLLPPASALMLRRLFPIDHGIRLLLFLTILSITYFHQSAPTVRPEVLGALLFVAFLTARGKKIAPRSLPTFLLALVGVVHPTFTLLAITLFGVGLFRRFQQIRLNNLGQWLGIGATFAVPFGILIIYYAVNFPEYQHQIMGRSSILSLDLFSAPIFIWDRLLFWSHPDGIIYGMYSGYPAGGFLAAMIISSALIFYRRTKIWDHDLLWMCLPMLFIQWFVFLLLPLYLPYLAFSSFLAGLNIVLLWQKPHLLVATNRLKLTFIGACFALSLVFIAFHSGKFVLISEERLTPVGLHSVMSPLMENPEAKLYTNAGRLIPPLIDHFSDGDNIQLNFIYLDPDCLPDVLMERANEHISEVVINSDPDNTYWGINRPNSDMMDGGEISFHTKGAKSTITLVPTYEIYADKKNLITQASSLKVSFENQVQCVE